MMVDEQQMEEEAQQMKKLDEEVENGQMDGNKNVNETGDGDEGTAISEMPSMLCELNPHCYWRDKATDVTYYAGDRVRLPAALAERLCNPPQLSRMPARGIMRMIDEGSEPAEEKKNG